MVCEILDVLTEEKLVPSINSLLSLPEQLHLTTQPRIFLNNAYAFLDSKEK